MSQGRRSQPLPPDWPRRKRRILRRDQRICHVCGQPGADEVDHIIPTAAGGTDEDTNLAAIHDTPCHRQKTGREARAAKPNRQRPDSQHPGLT